MSKAIKQIADPETAFRIMQRRIDRANAQAAESARLYAGQVERANRLEADLLRARAANKNLLIRVNQLQGNPQRLLLAA